jgi:hypothetical protein
VWWHHAIIRYHSGAFSPTIITSHSFFRLLDFPPLWPPKARISLYIIRQLPKINIAGLWNGCAAKGAASGDTAASIFLPQLVDFDLNFLSQFLSDFFNFRFKKLVSFSLIYINCLRDIWLDCGVVVQQSLPFPCRGDFPVSRGESRGLSDPCPSLLCNKADFL